MPNKTRIKLMAVDLKDEINVIGRMKSKKPITNWMSDLPDSIIKMITAAVMIAMKPPKRRFLIYIPPNNSFFFISNSSFEIAPTSSNSFSFLILSKDESTLAEL